MSSNDAPADPVTGALGRSGHILDRLTASRVLVRSCAADRVGAR